MAVTEAAVRALNGMTAIETDAATIAAITDTLIRMKKNPLAPQPVTTRQGAEPSTRRECGRWRSWVRARGSRSPRRKEPWRSKEAVRAITVKTTMLETDVTTRNSPERPASGTCSSTRS